MNTRAYHLEDAARLAMGNFMVEEAPPALSRTPLRTLAALAALFAAAVLAIAYLW